MGVGIRDQNTFGPYVGDEVFFARLPPEAQAEVAQWSNPVMPIADYLALCGRLQDAFPGVDLQFAPLNPDGCTEDLLRAHQGAGDGAPGPDQHPPARDAVPEGATPSSGGARRESSGWPAPASSVPT